MTFLNIKVKITLWYSFFMLLLVTGVLWIFVEFTGEILLENQKNELFDVVHDTVEDIERGKEIKFFDDGVFIIVYNNEKLHLAGDIPYDFPINFPLREEKLKKSVGENKVEFYTYDKKVKTKDGDEIWVRGVISNTQTKQITQKVLMTAFLGLPLLVVISIGIGYYLTKRAFLPVKKIQETAENITRNNELTLRINLPSGRDEISKLGATIDEMLSRLEESFKKEKQFTSDASHELRTPISVILAESEYILKHGDSLDEAKESMEVINRQAEKISALINQLLFLSRIDKGSVKLDKVKIDVGSVISELVEDNKFEAKKKDISISFRNFSNFKTILADKIMFIRALQNIIQNAINYGKNGGFIEIESSFDKDYLLIKVKDNGIGISRENLDKIWNRFYQVEESRNSSNFGLGLSMVKFIVEQHRGHVEVDSTLGEGSIFTLYFPIK